MNVNPDVDIMQWSVLQFNTGAANPFVIKCGATPSLELVVKAQAKIQDKSGKEMVSVVPPPSTLSGLSLDEIRQVLMRLPEAFCQLALAAQQSALKIHSHLGQEFPLVPFVICRHR